jgi:hypothetical protein
MFGLLIERESPEGPGFFQRKWKKFGDGLEVRGVRGG